ncbi:translocation/assembly module TamB domain-containing protein [Mucilaginibacter sp. OK098]|uniref:translocation/assembly module TamB domain-containing protein n=1 Tax=Mucilaginibacter sp. OK098 TaxID=1855297 RepID=UPI0009349373|nr:translocation/assembly module TamB domain-containing protein [Mucilaginibacter sp. OK098]
MIFSILLLVFQYKPVQTWAAKKATGYLSEKLNTTVGIQSLYIKPFSSVVLEGFYVLDKKKDTLLSTPKLEVDLSDFSLFSSLYNRVIDFKLIQLNNGSAYLKKQKDSTSNLQFIIDSLSGPTDTTKSKPWQVVFEKVAINNFHFRFKNLLVDTLVKGINFDDLDVKHFSVVIKNMDITNHLFKGNVTNLTLREKSGFYLKKFNADATIDTNQILAQNLFVLTNHSSIKNYFRMKFKSFDDVGSHIEDKVYMDGDFKSSKVSSTDIAYFTTGLENVKFDLGLDGRIKGYVNNLRAKNLTITGAKATYIKGDFNLKGLPDWNNTFLELNFDQIATNKADLDYLYSNFTGQHNAKVPDIISKFGNVNFSGRFTGLQNDFVAYGTFKTKLGRFDSDINLKINKAGVPAYSGKLDTYAFDLGELLDEQDLGRITMIANVKGSGDDLKTLNENVDAKISELAFKGYNYHNVALNGSFAKKLATGKLSINDKKIKLNGSGSVDLNPTLPLYSFSANVDNAKLHDLKLLDDTITFTSQVKANFSGNSLSNLAGEASLQKIRIVDPRNNYVIDSLAISATGKGNQRAINLKSDVADGYIKGSFDLATLPSYFKTIVKKYIPSLKTDITPPKAQDFAFNLTLKNIDPLIAIFVPDLKIPDQGTFVGEFNSEKKTATLNAYVKTIQYGKTVFHDFIIDEGTNADYLGLNLSLSKVNITDSLFIKNITVTNFLKNDSLNFNVKLSDKDAVNQLDLYGLVNFGRDTTAKLHILPSDVILEHQNWKILEKVRVKFLDGKTQVQGFELSNGQQKVKIDGFISDNPADKLKLTFQKFSMATLNQLTKSAGIQLKGSLNGDVNFTSIMNSPGIDAKLGIDSLVMNKTLVGDVGISSTLGNDRKQADVKINIKNRGLETVNLAGVYQIGHGTEDNLDFDVNMNQTEAIIFEPLIKDLVSNIKGTVSSNLKLTGPVSKPKLNGNIILNNTGVTVNYLKTPYTITDTVDVVNTVVKINNMTLRDAKNGTGSVTGTIDMNDLANPDIEVVVDAKNLMALNTNFKDNHLYYGTAYSTGRFSFNGPVDNMKINIKANTEAGTIFNIPLNTSMTVGDYDFIKFVSHNDTTKAAPKTLAFNGVTLNFDLTIDEKTVVKITTDYGVLEGSGQAKDLKLNINSLGDFEMFGDFLITSGKFEFTAKNFISKNFTVNQGGTIRWTGNPSNASINLNAIYEVRTDIQPLYQAAGSQSPKGRSLELVQAELILTKTLLQPTIDFDFNFPLDPSIKDDLSTYLSDNNNRSQQALSIIVRRNFSNGANNNLTNQVLGTAGEAVSEFAFNKLNSFISQSNIKNLDLNIRSFNDLGVSYRFKNRLILTGSLFNSTSGSSDLFNNNTSLFNSNFSQLTKDFEAQYLIRKDGNLSARYSYRVLNSTTLNTLQDQLGVQYVNGIGLVYQRDFDTFGEFIRNIFRSQNRKQPVKPSPIPPTTQTPATIAKPDDEDQ